MGVVGMMKDGRTNGILCLEVAGVIFEVRMLQGMSWKNWRVQPDSWMLKMANILSLYLTLAGSKWLRQVEHGLTAGEKVKGQRGYQKTNLCEINFTKNYDWNNTGEGDEASTVKIFQK